MIQLIVTKSVRVADIHVSNMDMDVTIMHAM